MTPAVQLYLITVAAVVGLAWSVRFAWQDLSQRGTEEPFSYLAVFLELKRRDQGRWRRFARRLGWS